MLSFAYLSHYLSFTRKHSFCLENDIFHIQKSFFFCVKYFFEIYMILCAGRIFFFVDQVDLRKYKPQIIHFLFLIGNHECEQKCTFSSFLLIFLSIENPINSSKKPYKFQQKNRANSYLKKNSKISTIYLILSGLTHTQFMKNSKTDFFLKKCDKFRDLPRTRPCIVIQTINNFVLTPILILFVIQAV